MTASLESLTGLRAPAQNLGEVELAPLFSAEEYRGSSLRFGVDLHPDGGDFAVHAGSSVDFVDLCIQNPDEPSDTKLRWRLAESTDDSGEKAFTGFIPGLKPGDVYCPRAGGEYNPPYSLCDYNNPLLDPYARQVRIHQRSTLNSCEPFPLVPYAVVVDPTYNWENDQPLHIDASSRVIYEAHIRGTTMLHPDIPEEDRGTYAGFASEAHIAHLKKLGITAVELLPVQQFLNEPFVSERGTTNYWGYNTLGFFAPNEGYASTENPVQEFKDMVKKLHAAGVEIIMDVVYNHTAEGGAAGPVYSLKGLDNEGMYHIDQHGNYMDDTGCGNMLKASGPALKLILDSLHYWVQEMHVDGFRFDLAPALTRDHTLGGRTNMDSPFMRAIKSDEVLRDKVIIAEPWDIRGVPEGALFHRTDPHWKELSRDFRDGTRSIWREGGSTDIDWFSKIITGVGMPAGSVNFVTAHDGFTMADLVSYGQKHNELNGEYNGDGTDDNRSSNHGVEGKTEDPDVLQRRQQAARNMMLTLALASGTPMVLGGDELLRTQGGNNNAYCQDNETSWTSWDLDEAQRQKLAFTRGSFSIRKSNGQLGDPASVKERPIRGNPIGEQPIAWLDARGTRMTPEKWHSGEKVVAMYRSGVGAASVGHSILVYTNLSYQPQEVLLPQTIAEKGVYGELADTASGVVDTEAMKLSPNVIVMPPRSMRVLQRQSTPLPQSSGVANKRLAAYFKNVPTVAAISLQR